MPPGEEATLSAVGWLRNAFFAARPKSRARYQLIQACQDRMFIRRVDSVGWNSTEVNAMEEVNMKVHGYSMSKQSDTGRYEKKVHTHGSSIRSEDRALPRLALAVSTMMLGMSWMT